MDYARKLIASQTNRHLNARSSSSALGYTATLTHDIRNANKHILTIIRKKAKGNTTDNDQSKE